MQHPLFDAQRELIERLGGAPNGGAQRTPHLWSLLSGGLRHLANTARHAMALGWALLLIRLSIARRIGSLHVESVDIVVKTWCVGDREASGGWDFYFGDLPNRLRNLGLSVLLLAGSPIWSNRTAFARRETDASAVVPRVAELVLLRFGCIPAMLLDQIRSCTEFVVLAIRAADPIRRELYARCAVESLAAETFEKGLYYWVGRALGSRVHPRAVLTLYEGRSWEACLWRGVRDVSPRARILGYQHAAVFPTSLSVRRPDADDRDAVPDVVLCSGSVTKRMLEEGYKALGTHLQVLGSFRRSGRECCPPQPSRRTLLVLPEGFLDESVFLFEATLEIAQKMPDYRFVLRLHPLLSFDDVVPLLSGLPENLPNISRSAGTDLLTDLAEASVVLYRGTSAVFGAVEMGLKPIYLHWTGRPTVDPLFGLRAWREQAVDTEALRTVLSAYERRSPESCRSEWTAALNYVRSCAEAVDESGIRAVAELVRREHQDLQRK